MRLPSEPIEVLVAGATGALGSRICARLSSGGAHVLALLRGGAAHASAEGLRAAGVEVVEGDVTHPRSLLEAVRGVSCVVSTVTSFPREVGGAIDRVDQDGNVALVDAAEASGIERFVFVSFRPVPLEFPLQRAKRAVEARLHGAALDALVLKPGKFMDVWFSPICGFDHVACRAAVFGSGVQPVTWIAAADVAEIAARAALGGGPRSGSIELGGPDPLSQRDVVRVYEELTGRTWTIDEIAVEELERRLQTPADEVDESLAALMLETHLGSVTDPDGFLAEFPIELTTVRKFAARKLASIEL